jgi:hypothetical protein
MVAPLQVQTLRGKRRSEGWIASPPCTCVCSCVCPDACVSVCVRACRLPAHLLILARSHSLLLLARAPSQLTELKDTANPPESVKLLVEAVLLLMGFKQREARDWSTARALMGSPSFMLQLQAFGKCRPVACLRVGEHGRVSRVHARTALIQRHVHALAPARQIATGSRRLEPSGMRK